jgi:hypothetical protein
MFKSKTAAFKMARKLSERYADTQYVVREGKRWFVCGSLRLQRDLTAAIPLATFNKGARVL